MELRLSLSKGQLCIANGISQRQQLPGEEVLNEIQRSLKRVYLLVFIIQVLNSVVGTKKYLTSRFQITLYNKFNTFSIPNSCLTLVKEVQNTRSSHPCYWQLAGRFTTKPPSECFRIRKMGEAYPQGFQKSLLCLQNCEVNNNKTTSLLLNIFSAPCYV